MSFDSKQRARVIIGEVLNLALNRHAHILTDDGYLDQKKYAKDYGYNDEKAKPALVAKWKLIEEICERFEYAIADYLDHPRDQLWPLHEATPNQTTSANDLHTD